MSSASAIFNPTVTSIKCPACGKVGSSPRPIPVGAKVKCKCGNSFTATLDDDEAYSPLIPPPSGAIGSGSPLIPPTAWVASIPDDDVTPLPDDLDIPITVTVVPGKRGPGPEPWYYSHLETDGKSIASYADLVMWIAFFCYLAFASLLIFGAVGRINDFSINLFGGMIVVIVVVAVPYVFVVLAIRWGIRSVAAGILMSVDHARNARATRWNSEP